VPDLVLEGEVAGDRFGAALSTAGDVDNDGYADFVVGAPGQDSGGADAGRIYLFLGGDPPAGFAIRTWDGPVAGDHFGASVAGGFNFNQDAYGDFAAGAPDHNGIGTRAGLVRIYLGASTSGGITQPAALSFLGDAANWLLGYSLDRAGDVNQDGYGDLIAGAPQLFDANPGQAVVWLGQSSTSTPPSRIQLTGTLGAERFGFSVSSAGDLDDDGFGDVIVGAPAYSAAGLHKGAVYLFHGGDPMNPTFDWRAVGSVGGDSLGYAVDGGFDLDGDLVPDFAAGAPGANRPNSGSGEVRVFLGSADPDTNADLSLPPLAPNPSFTAGDRFGAAVAFGGSYNGDAYAELLAGAPQGNIISGETAGYVDVLAQTGTVVPVRVLSFQVRAVGAMVELTWELADPDGLFGVRVEADRNGGTTPLHEGWLPAASGGIVDRDPQPGRTLYRLLGRNRQGDVNELASLPFEGGSATLSLGMPRANPFRDRLQVPATFPGGEARVTVWDLQGRLVRVLMEASVPAGVRELEWDGRDGVGRPVPPGMYFLRIEAGGASAGQKVVRLP